MSSEENFKRINISLDESLAQAFDKYAKESGLTKSALLRSFIKLYDGKLASTALIEKQNITSYNFKIEKDLYNHISNLAKEHLTSISGIMRLIIANNILIKDGIKVPIAQEQWMKEKFDYFNTLNIKVQDIDRTTELLKRYAEIKNQKGFNFSSIKTFAQRRDLEKISNSLHDAMSQTMNLFLLEKNSNFNTILIDERLKEVTKLLNKYELSLKYFETSIEYYDIENPFFVRTKAKLNSYHENLMYISVGKFENVEYLCDFHSYSLMRMGEFTAQLIDFSKIPLKIMCLGPGSYPGIFYTLIGLSKEERLKDSKIQIDIYEPCLPKQPKNEDTINETMLMEKEVSIRIGNQTKKVSLINHIKSLGLSCENIKINFLQTKLTGEKGTYLGIHNFIEDLFSQNKIYDVNLIYSVETIHDLPEALSIMKNRLSKDAIVGCSHMIFSGDEAPRIYEQNDKKRIERKVFSVAMRKIQQFLIQTNMDKFWLPIIMRPDLNMELNDYFNRDEKSRTEYMSYINKKGMYFEMTPMETHTLESPFGCLTFGMRKAKFLMKKETSIFEKGKTIDYHCSVAVTRI